MRTERLTILLTPDERSELNAKADELGLNASDFVRLAVESYDTTGDKELLEQLALQLTESVTQTRAALDEAKREVEATLAYFAAKRLKQAA